MSGRVVFCTGPAVGALVYIPGRSFNVVADANGDFSFSYVPTPGAGQGYDLVVVPSGQSSQTFPLAVSFGTGDIDVPLGDIVLSNTTNDNGNCGACGNVCSGGLVCTNSACVAAPLLNNGNVCSSAGQCASGNCVDGVCANTACAAVCQAANLPGSTGTCQFVPFGQDPDNECANSACNGAGACTVAPATCSDALKNGTETDVDCGGANCADCALGKLCFVGGDCQSNTCTLGMCAAPLLAQGSACVSGPSCQSGNCVDGFCANTSCGTSCMAAAQAKTGQPNGVCAPIQFNTDPDNECNASGGGVCGSVGVCNGAGACSAFPPAGTVCAAPSCSNGVAMQAASCTGTGTCAAQAPVSCGAYSCNAGGTACNTVCATDSQCAVGSVCSASVCVASR